MKKNTLLFEIKVSCIALLLLSLLGTKKMVSAAPSSHGRAKSANINSNLITIVGNDYQEIIGTVNAKVGERIQLSCFSKDPKSPVTAIEWAFGNPEQALYKYEPTTSNAEKIQLSQAQLNSTTNKISFFWVTGGMLSLSCSGFVGSKKFSTIVRFNIKRPNIVMESSIKNVQLVNINGQDGIVQLGNCASAGYVTASQFGIQIKVKDALYEKLEPYEEEWCFVQTIASVGRSGLVPGYVLGGNVWYVPNIGVDAPQGQWFYNQNSPSMLDAPAQTNNAYLEGYGTNIYRVDPLYIDESFETYFMYKSRKDLSSWVPIAVLKWSWKGTVSLSAWSLNAPSTPLLENESSKSDANSFNTNQFPEWSSNANKIKYWIRGAK